MASSTFSVLDLPYIISRSPATLSIVWSVFFTKTGRIWSAIYLCNPLISSSLALFKSWYLTYSGTTLFISIHVASCLLYVSKRHIFCQCRNFCCFCQLCYLGNTSFCCRWFWMSRTHCFQSCHLLSITEFSCITGFFRICSVFTL